VQNVKITLTEPIEVVSQPKSFRQPELLYKESLFIRFHYINCRRI
jgi:hypothetical protein